jgi:G3E family GTPase
MRLVQIAGYLGSGKTTLIIALSRHLSEGGKKVAILVNDVGEVPVDGKVMEEYGLAVKDIGGGCICCQVAGSMRTTLRILDKSLHPDLIFIEPTGIAVPGAIRKVAQLDSGRLSITFGPTVVLFDVTRMEKLLTYDPLRRLVATQVRDAEVIALSKVDRATEESMEEAAKAMRQINVTAEVVRLSTRTGEGFPRLLQAIEEMEVTVP